MLGWFRALMPKEDKFFDLFDAHARTIVEAAAALNALLTTTEPDGFYAAEINRLEQQADDIARDVLLATRRSFITPFDRSDIHDLITSMDDAIDQMRKTAKSIHLFELKSFEPNMIALGAIIEESAKLAAESVNGLRKIQANAPRLHALAEEITQLEERSDDLHHAGLKALFHDHTENQAMKFISGADVYDHLEKVVDRLEDVGERTNSIVVEHL
jgi:predicted phosphate transport protein (TIGR00153 family)